MPKGPYWVLQASVLGRVATVLNMMPEDLQSFTWMKIL